VWVKRELKGKHREHCLCYDCLLFDQESREDSCLKANTIFALCQAFDMVLPVWECPDFLPEIINKES